MTLLKLIDFYDLIKEKNVASVIEAVQAILSLHYNGGKTPKLII